MAIAYVKEVGKATGSGTTLTIPVTAAPAAGNLLVVRVGFRASATVVVSAATDTKGNTLTVNAFLDGSGGHVAVISDPQDVAALTGADSITVTLSASAGNGIAAIVDEFSGVDVTSTRLDKTATASVGSGTARDSGTTAATTQAAELAVSAFAGNGAETSFTADKSAFTTGFLNAVVGTGAFVEGEYAILAATGTQDHAPAGGLSVATSGCIVTYKAAAAGSAPANTGAPSISGTAKVGSTLTANDGTWSGSPTPTITRQWKRNGVAIGGATATTYTLVSADDATTITVTVTATNTNGNASATSVGVGPITYPTPTNTAAPSISGATTVGSTLTGADGTWTSSPTSFTRQWYRDGVAIGGATGATYTIVTADQGHTLTFGVRATNDGGTSAESQSAGLVIPAAGTANRVVRDTINGWCSWGAYNVGLLSFDTSLFGGADVFGVSPLDATFGGTYDDISSRLQRIVIRRGRNDNLTTMLAGDADIDLRDPAGLFNPDNTAGPLYGQLEDRLHPIKIQSTYGGVTYPRMYMWVDKFTWQPSGRRGITQLHCIDLFYWLDGCFPVIASTGPTTTGAAIGKVLDAAGATDPAMRDLDAGDTIPDFSADGTVSGLDLIQGLLDAERGVFFVAATGKATYRSRLARLTKTSVATITDHMHQLNPGADFNQIQTRVRVTRTQSGYTATAVAAGTVLQKRGYRDMPEISTAYLLTDSQADGLADWVLSQVASPKPPVENFAIDNREDALLQQILQRELVDRITVHDTRGGTVGDFHIDSITETIDYSQAAASHQAEWLLSRASAIVPAEFDFATFDNGYAFVY